MFEGVCYYQFFGEYTIASCTVPEQAQNACIEV